jgi:NADH-quinone oxidoreductase subunit G
LVDGQTAQVVQGEGQTELKVVIDDAVADGCVVVPSAVNETAALGASFGPVEIKPQA